MIPSSASRMQPTRQDCLTGDTQQGAHTTLGQKRRCDLQNLDPVSKQKPPL